MVDLREFNLMEHVFLMLIDFRLRVENASFLLTQLKNLTFSSETRQFAFRKLLHSLEDEKPKCESEVRNIRRLPEQIRRNSTSPNLTDER